MRVPSPPTTVATLLGLLLGLGPSLAGATHSSPASAGQTKISVFDETYDGWDVHSSTPDPVIGFVNFRPPTAGDLNHLILVVALERAAPSCDYGIELVLWGTTLSGGLAADDFHHGRINRVGSMDTNAAGRGNSGAIRVDVTTLLDALPGVVNYAHVDIEDYDGDCVEADGTPVLNNEYAGADSTQLAPGVFGTRLHWLQP